LLPQVIDLFKEHSLSLSTFNVLKAPTINTAFALFMKRKDELLCTTKSTAKIFAYLNQVYQYNEQSFNASVADVAFIPVAG
jgi:hypothetical protein